VPRSNGPPDGLATEKETWGRLANWCDYSGEIDGERLGIVHPGDAKRADIAALWLKYSGGK